MYEARVLPFRLFACCRKFHCASKETLRTAIKEVRGKPPTAKERGQRRVGKDRQQFCHFVGFLYADKMTVLERRFATPISGQGEQVGNEHNLNRAISPVEWERFWYLLSRDKSTDKRKAHRSVPFPQYSKIPYRAHQKTESLMFIPENQA